MWERMHIIYAIWQKTCSAAQIFFPEQKAAFMAFTLLYHGEDDIY